MKGTFLSRFTPSMMTPEALEALFVQREDLAHRLVELIRESALTQSKHHSLLVGPRGIGKTHLISLIYHRIRAMEELQGRLLIAWLREEEWGVTSFLDLLLRIFRALQAEYKELVPADRLEALYKLSPTVAEREGAKLLKELSSERTLLILAENLDDVFAGLGDQGQKQLRSYLQENPFCTILATSQSLFNGVSLQTSPFYGFFRIRHLEELTLEDATLLLANIADFEGDKELPSFIQTPLGRARVRAVHHLAGGNHRVYVIFSQFLTRESLDEFVDPFMRTLDDLTPYYQARMAWLSPQQRKIVEFLCDARHAVVVKEIAQRCFLSHQTTSSQLKTLREMGYVSSEAVGRESYYELREPLMRLCIEVKKNRGEPIRLFVDFLRNWYSREELQQRLDGLPSTGTEVSVEREHLLAALVEPKPSRVRRVTPESGNFAELIKNRSYVSSSVAEDTEVQLVMTVYRRARRMAWLSNIDRDDLDQDIWESVLKLFKEGRVPPISLQDLSIIIERCAKDILRKNREEDFNFFPPHLLDAADRYSEAGDQRIFLELPVEERLVLRQLLELSQTP